MKFSSVSVSVGDDNLFEFSERLGDFSQHHIDGSLLERGPHLDHQQLIPLGLGEGYELIEL